MGLVLWLDTFRVSFCLLFPLNAKLRFRGPKNKILIRIWLFGFSQFGAVDWTLGLSSEQVHHPFNTPYFASSLKNFFLKLAAKMWGQSYKTVSASRPIYKHI